MGAAAAGANTGINGGSIRRCTADAYMQHHGLEGYEHCIQFVNGSAFGGGM
jgi:hypothetical protein